jgi:hypothetical protein
MPPTPVQYPTYSLSLLRQPTSAQGTTFRVDDDGTLHVDVATTNDALKIGPTGGQAIASASANAFTVGANGTTNPALNVDDSTASSATGVNIKSAAAAAGVAVAVLSSGTNENLTIDAKGSGSITLNGTATGGVLLGARSTITSAGAGALTVGPNGITNPTFNVDASTASAATGLNVKGAAAAAGLALSVVSSGAAENLTIDAKGTGTLTLQGTASGAISLARATSITGATTVTSAVANALAVGQAGTTNPALQVDASTASSATGISIKSAAAAAGVAVSVISSGAAENLTIAAKGTTGTITFQPAIAVPAGGSAAGSVLMSSTAALGVYFGSGAPTVSAAQGSLYIRTDGSSTSTRLYVNTNGAGTWTNVTTAA